MDIYYVLDLYDMYIDALSSLLKVCMSAIDVQVNSSFLLSDVFAVRQVVDSL